MKRAFAGRLFAASVLLSILAACNGNGSTTLPSTVPAASDGLRVAITIKVSIVADTRSARPHFISPATKSIKLIVLRGSKTVLTKIASLTPSSTGCTSTMAGTACTLLVSLAAGAYTASLTTYSGTNATGSVLSVAQKVPFTVKSAGTNVVPLALSGVPHSIAVGANGANAIYAIVRDAAGNFIVGSGAPKLTAIKTGGATVAAIVQPSAASPNVISFKAATPPVSGSETIGITASYSAPLTNACQQSGAVCTFSNVATAAYGQQLLLANYGDSNILRFALPLTSSSAANLVLNLYEPYPILLDANDKMFVGSYTTSGPLAVYSAPYGSGTYNSNAVNNPYGFALDANDDVFVANYGNSSVTEYKSPYTGAPSVTVTNGVDTPYAVAIDSSNRLYVANHGNATVTEYDYPYTGAPITIMPASNTSALAIRGSTLFVASDAAGINTYTLPLTNNQHTTATVYGAPGIYQMIFDNAGNLWTAEEDGGAMMYGAIAKFTLPLSDSSVAAVQIEETNTGSHTYYPYGIGFDAAGNLYVSNYSGGSNAGGIDEYAPPISSASTPKVSLSGTIFNHPYFFAITHKSTFTVTPQ